MSFEMLPRGIVLLILGVAAVPSILSQDTTDVDSIVDFCVKTTQLFAENEHDFTKKHKRDLKTPDLFFPQKKELKFRAYEIEKRQRPFECITNYLNGSFSELDKSKKYQDLVRQCKYGQFQPECDPDYPYRTIDGTCNNLDNPIWGSVLSCGKRLFPASYEGAAGFRKSVCDNQDLPSARYISTTYLDEETHLLHLTSAHFVYFGQFVAHDIGDTPVTFVEDKPLECCSNLGDSPQHPQCAPILIDEDDHFYSKTCHHLSVTCQGFVRSAMCDTCSVGPRSQMDEPTAYMDLSQTYDITEASATMLRKLDGSGQLRVQETEHGDLLPIDEDSEPNRCGNVKNYVNSTRVVDEGQDRKKRDVFDEVLHSFKYEGGKDKEYCFKAGDRRGNQHTMLMSYHTLLVREHNRIAAKLKEINPHWSEEKLYQEARKINIAQYQVMVFREFLPILIGPDLMSEYGLWIEDTNARTEYDSSVNPSIAAEFSTAAYRLHSFVDFKVSLLGVNGLGGTYLRNLYQNTSPLYAGKLEPLLLGMGAWPYQKYDTHFAKDITKYLYKELRGHYGFDLTSVNIQRGRDNGMPSYVEVLKKLHDIKDDIKDFEDLLPYMDLKTIRLLENIYCDVNDIDLWVGTYSERIENDLHLPPTPGKIIAGQFQRLKYGDRFYFEHDGQFTDEQLDTLKNASFSKLMCDNTNLLFMQPHAIQFPCIENFYVPCYQLPEVDLEKWREYLEVERSL